MEKIKYLRADSNPDVFFIKIQGAVLIGRLSDKTLKEAEPLEVPLCFIWNFREHSSAGPAVVPSEVKEILCLHGIQCD